MDGKERPSTVFGLPFLPALREGGKPSPLQKKLYEYGLSTFRQVFTLDGDKFVSLLKTDRKGDVTDAIDGFLKKLTATPQARLLADLTGFPNTVFPLPAFAETEQKKAVEQAFQEVYAKAKAPAVPLEVIKVRYGFYDGIERTGADTSRIVTLLTEDKVTKDRANAIIMEIKRRLSRGSPGRLLLGFVALPPDSLARKMWGRLFWKDLPFQSEEFKNISYDDFNWSQLTLMELAAKGLVTCTISELVHHDFSRTPLTQKACDEIYESLKSYNSNTRPPGAYVFGDGLEIDWLDEGDMI